jgi:hypothetical protein
MPKKKITTLRSISKMKNKFRKPLRVKRRASRDLLFLKMK